MRSIYRIIFEALWLLLCHTRLQGTVEARRVRAWLDLHESYEKS